MRLAYDAVGLAYRARSLRDLVVAHAGDVSPAAEAAAEAAEWAIETADRLADQVAREYGWKSRPPIVADDERETMAERLESVHLEVGLEARERHARKRGVR